MIHEYSMKKSAITRRKRALKRLEYQIATGKKIFSDSGSFPIPLSEKDKMRIGKEIETLKQRI